MKDPYSVLGVSKTADDRTIKSAFRKLAKRYHPDQNADDPSAQEKFAQVNTAYEILGDKEKRAQFDRGEIDAEGKPKFAGFGAGGPFAANPFGGGGFARDYQGTTGSGQSAGGFSAEDILKEIFGGATRQGPSGGPQFGGSPFGRTQQKTQTPPVRGMDAEATLTVSLEALGSTEKVRVNLPTGKSVSVALPPGVEEGQVIRLRGQGYETAGQGPAGDALITVVTAPHKYFTREGDVLRCRLPITLYEAVLGGKVKAPTLKGMVALTIPKGASSGQTLRLKERGIIKKDKKPGDILVDLQIVLPDNGLEDLETMMEVWRDQRSYRVRGPEFD